MSRSKAHPAEHIQLAQPAQRQRIIQLAYPAQGTHPARSTSSSAHTFARILELTLGTGITSSLPISARKRARDRRRLAWQRGAKVRGRSGRRHRDIAPHTSAWRHGVHRAAARWTSVRGSSGGHDPNAPRWPVRLQQSHSGTAQKRKQRLKQALSRPNSPSIVFWMVTDCAATSASTSNVCREQAAAAGREQRRASRSVAGKGLAQPQASSSDERWPAMADGDPPHCCCVPGCQTTAA